MSTRPIYHPHKDEHGKPVALHKPSQATLLGSWADPQAVATVIPDGPMPAGLHGIPFAPWHEAPVDAKAWAIVPGQLDFAEPPFVNAPGRHEAAGAIILESDGRVWLVSPSNGFAGYTNTFPKGWLDGAVSRQACAIREVFEESGLQVEITGILADLNRSQTRTRYYLARRIGGTPAAMGWESQAVHLVPVAQLGQFLTNANDAPLLELVPGLLQAS